MDFVGEDLLTNPPILYSRSEIVSKPCPVPKERGLYAWFFKEIPPRVLTEGCVTKDGLTLLYVGISPKDEVSNGNLRERIKTHYRGNAYGSTLRLTLGILLEKQSTFPLRRVGSNGKRKTFTHLGEQWIDRWMEANAFVTWVTHSAPWEVEAGLFKNLSLPLNIQDNDHHPFAKQLSNLRKEAKKNAEGMPIADESNETRSS